MKVAVDLRQYSLSETGGTTYALGLAQHLAGRTPTIDLTLLVAPGSVADSLQALRERASVVEIAPPHLRPRGPVPLARRLVHDVSPRSHHPIDGFGADVAHFPGDRITPWHVETPAVVSFFGANHWVLPHHVYWSSKPVQRMARANVVRSLRRADAVLVPSLFVKSVLVNQLELDPESIVIRELVSWAGGIRDEVAEDPQVGALDGTSGFLLYSASHVTYKNQDRLVRAYAELSASERRAHPLIITGGAREAIEHVANAVGVGDDVHHLGYVPRSQLVWLYRNATGYIHPSLYEAGGSFSMFEAAFSGTAVACSGIGSMAETMPVAVHFDPYDISSITGAIRSLMDPANAGLADICRSCVESYELHDSVDRVIRAYELAIARAKASPRSA